MDDIISKLNSSLSESELQKQIRKLQEAGFVFINLREAIQESESIEQFQNYISIANTWKNRQELIDGFLEILWLRMEKRKNIRNQRYDLAKKMYDEEGAKENELWLKMRNADDKRFCLIEKKMIDVP